MKPASVTWQRPSRARRAARAQRNRDVRSELRAALLQREAYLTAAAHDMKNQFGVIQGMAQLLERQLRRVNALEPARLLRGLALIQNSTHKLQLLVDELLDLTRLQAGEPVQLNRQPSDLVAIAAACVADFSESAGRVITLTPTVETLVGQWDATRLERVLANLLANALKYSPAEDDVRVLLDHDHDSDPACAVLAVQDEGVGIPTDELARIGQPFFRASNVRQQIAGTGIGLFGARAIVEQHGGTLRVDSTVGKGTTVTARLPVAPPASGNPPSASPRLPLRPLPPT